MKAIYPPVHPSTAPFSYESMWGKEIARLITKSPDVFIGGWMNLPPVPKNQKLWKRFCIRTPRES